MFSYLLSRAIYATLSAGGLLSGIIFVGIPLAFYNYPIMERVIFLTNQNVDGDSFYQQPDILGFEGAKNFYLENEDGVRLGVWHTLPVGLKQYPEQQELFGQTIILYMHGNGEHRRKALKTYDLLNDLRYHVVTFDYRGFAESTGKATRESDLVTDARTVFKWVKNKFPDGKIYFWGFSLGSGVACSLAYELAQRNVNINGIILESSFNNMADLVKSKGKLLSRIPFYDKCLVEPLKTNGMSFPNDQYLSKIETPVLILHAESDKYVSACLSDKLYKTVLNARKGKGMVKLIKYDAEVNLNHGYLVLHPDIPFTVKQFVEETTKLVTG